MEDTKNKSTKGGAKWNEVVIGGVSGISLGIGSAFLMGSAAANDVTTISEGTIEQEENAHQEEAIDNGYAAMASNVTDDMSFDEAFAAAREEVGPGGVFEWHGSLYGTYYASEWNNMDASQREEFANSVPWHSPEHHNEHHVNTNETETETETDGGGDDQDIDFEVIGVEHANLDGEHDSIIGAANFDGQTVYFVDIDGTDNEFDVMMADFNGNANIDDDEIIDISDEHISVSDFEAMAGDGINVEDNLDNMYADNDSLPDYVNDVDPGNLG